jgi:hypothetical protein
MAKTPDTDVTIEALLEQRTQYEEWLAKLDNSGDKAPPAVRERIRGDYQSRLQSVMEQLRGRGSAISEELERHHASQAELDRQRRAAEEALAESEVRHSVGEYTEDEWRRLSDQSRQQIEQLRAELRSIGTEITRLTQVQSLIAAPRAAASASTPPAATPRPAPKPEPKPELVEQAPFVTHVADPMADPAAPPPRTAPQQPAPQPEPAAAEVDELTFLKSVSDEDPPAPRRTTAGGSSTATSAPPRVAEVQTATPASSGKAGAAVAKTLKCGDCGTLNRPTEWYCERCGAELAGV